MPSVSSMVAMVFGLSFRCFSSENREIPVCKAERIKLNLWKLHVESLCSENLKIKKPTSFQVIAELSWLTSYLLNPISSFMIRVCDIPSIDTPLLYRWPMVSWQHLKDTAPL